MVTRIRGRGRRPQHLYIAEWMEYRGLSDERMAGRLDPPVSRETVTRWRNQQHRLRPDKQAQIAAALDIEPSELWSPPPGAQRPNINALVRDWPDEAVKKLAEFLPTLRPTGTT